MKFNCYSNWDQLPKNSQTLFSAYEKDSLFFSREWFENLVETALEDDQSLLLVCVINGNDLLAILPLITRDNREWSSLCHLYSSLYTVLLTENDQQEILTCLCQGLKELPFDYLTLDPVADDDCNINSLQQTMETSGFSCYRNFHFYNWFHQTQGQTFTDYMADRPARVRNTIARKKRKLEREHSVEIRLHIDSGVEQALANYHDIYKVSWKANEQYEGIVKGFTNRVSKTRWTRLAILYVNDKPVAAHLWYVVHRKASIFRLVYDQDWKQYSPGSILMSYLMEYVIDIDKVEEIDFLTGNDRYKQDWMSERRERWRLSCVKKPEPKERINLLTKISINIKKLFK